MSPASEVRASGRLAVPAAFLHSPAPGSARAGGSGTPGARPAPGPVRRAGSRHVRAEDVEVTEPPKVTSGEAATPRPQPAGNRALPAVLGRSVFQGEAAVAGSAGTPGSRARGGAGPQQTRGHTSCAGAARRNSHARVPVRAGDASSLGRVSFCRVSPALGAAPRTVGAQLLFAPSVSAAPRTVGAQPLCQPRLEQSSPCSFTHFEALSLSFLSFIRQPLCWLLICFQHGCCMRSPSQHPRPQKYLFSFCFSAPPSCFNSSPP